jgi:molecular chaperone DnaK
LDAAIDSAHLAPGELQHLLLIGGSSRIPLIAQAISARLGAGVRLDRELDPKLVVAMGAALTAGADLKSMIASDFTARTQPDAVHPVPIERAPVPVSVPAPARPVTEAIETPIPTQASHSDVRWRHARRGLVGLALAASAVFGSSLGHGWSNGDHGRSLPSARLQQARPAALPSAVTAPAPVSPNPEGNTERVAARSTPEPGRTREATTAREASAPARRSPIVPTKRYASAARATGNQAVLRRPAPIRSTVAQVHYAELHHDRPFTAETASDETDAGSSSSGSTEFRSIPAGPPPAAAVAPNVAAHP